MPPFINRPGTPISPSPIYSPGYDGSESGIPPPLSPYNLDLPSPDYSPTFPIYSPTYQNYSPTSACFSSPETGVDVGGSPDSPTYSPPDTPIYSPASPIYSPGLYYGGEYSPGEPDWERYTGIDSPEPAMQPLMIYTVDNLYNWVPPEEEESMLQQNTSVRRAREEVSSMHEDGSGTVRSVEASPREEAFITFRTRREVSPRLTGEERISLQNDGIVRPLDVTLRRFNLWRNLEFGPPLTITDDGERWNNVIARPTYTTDEQLARDINRSQSEMEAKRKRGEFERGDTEEDEGKVTEEKLKMAANFECNICFEMAKDPVVTSCGHLYCWACVYQWMHLKPDDRECLCPVCKGAIGEENITPIYGRGSTEPNESKEDIQIPPRPAGNRVESLRQTLPPVSQRFPTERMLEAYRIFREGLPSVFGEDQPAQGAPPAAFAAPADASAAPAAATFSLTSFAAPQLLSAELSSASSTMAVIHSGIASNDTSVDSSGVFSGMVRRRTVSGSVDVSNSGILRTTRRRRS